MFKHYLPFSRKKPRDKVPPPILCSLGNTEDDNRNFRDSSMPRILGSHTNARHVYSCKKGYADGHGKDAGANAREKEHLEVMRLGAGCFTFMYSLFVMY